MLKFDCETIPNNKQRYPTVGDYATDIFGVTHFKISELENWKYEFLISIHEIIEKFLCKAAGVQEIDIDTFDIKYEKERPENDFSEPGNSEEAPYHRQHLVASYVENLLLRELGLNSIEYEKVINSL